MTEIKTKVNDASVKAFLNAVQEPVKRADSFKLLEIFEKVTGEPAKMWGTSMIGFGKYHYKSERSRQEGDWPLTGFSPRKQNLTIYIQFGFDDLQAHLDKLGKHKKSVGCLYINKLADVDLDVLEKVIKHGYDTMKQKFPA
jgi:hypothetical protein